jgi:ATP-dependent DNA ligase
MCKGEEHLHEELEKIEKKGGEGLMLRDPKSSYKHSRFI